MTLVPTVSRNGDEARMVGSAGSTLPASNREMSSNQPLLGLSLAHCWGAGGVGRPSDLADLSG